MNSLTKSTNRGALVDLNKDDERKRREDDKRKLEEMARRQRRDGGRGAGMAGGAFQPAGTGPAPGILTGKLGA